MRDSAPESHCWEFKVVSFEPDGRIRYQSKVDFASRIRRRYLLSVPFQSDSLAVLFLIQKQAKVKIHFK
ncbi:hypothetical protein HYQ46_010757 [Verticillium longisporum]|uniref:Uncharacterized protein n=1 Tax=Verticillium dahliae TaxID=27337 RepID=A0A444RJV8_VERDA|nr:hypothetical protein HYQ44_015568 [Verticillium longisporum]KAG7122907.1 hypothetical protein HYQ46_010757 [Verticillium longisporum]RXG41399.1 hypothetical protein VDGE_30547 [Verticillium dahliae]